MSPNSSLLFRDLDFRKAIHEEEKIPFYHPTQQVEENIYEFLASSKPDSKAKIMTLFDSPYIGKTTILNQLPNLYTNVYKISIPRELIILLCHLNQTNPQEYIWNIFFG